jgi:hypothetical protein
MIAHPHTRVIMSGHLFMKHLLKGGLVMVGQSSVPSPHVTLLAVFLWQYVKDYVYRTSVGDITTLPSRIIEKI